MTKTVQALSWAYLSKEGKNLNTDKPEAEDNKNLMLPVFDSLNKLYESLNKLDYVLKRKT
jgi:hypothetical protein